MKPVVRTSILVPIAFLVWYIVFKQFSEISDYLNQWFQAPLAVYFLTYLITGIPLFIGTWVIQKDIRISKPLGLHGNIVKALFLAFIFTIPMISGGLVCNGIQENLNSGQLIKSSIFAGFFEELYFRGFLFGIVFRYTPLGFIPSVLGGAVLFSAGHLTQSTDPAELAGVLLITFMGGVFFAWLYAEWRYNLWVPIWMHTFMNLSWHLFGLGETAAGGMLSNVLRALTITTAILMTIYFKKKAGVKFEVQQKTLFWKNET